MQERGFTNRFEFFPTNECGHSGLLVLTTNMTSIPQPTSPLTLAHAISHVPLEVWFEYVWGRGGSNPLIRYAKAKTDEQMIQFGAEYEYNDLVNFIVNAGAAIANLHFL